MSISKKMKEWYTSIEALQFQGIAEALQEVLPEANPKYNQQMDSLLARLTHAYIKYSDSKRGDIKTGLVIYKLTCCLCERFSDSFNPPRLRSGVYHITRCLRELELFSESQEICNYVIPGKIFSLDSKDHEYYFKLSYAWRQSAETIIKSFSAEFDSKNYNTLLEIVKFDFQLLKYTENESYSKVIFSRFQKYIEKITQSGNSWSESKIITFFREIIAHIRMMELNSSLKINPLEIYDEIIEIMHSLSYRMINAAKIDGFSNFINKCTSELEVFLVKDSQALKCFKLHLDFYKTLLIPVSSFDKNMLEEICNYRYQFRSRLKSFGPSKIMLANASGVYKILTSIFNYWLECMKTCETEFINKIFYEMVKFVNQIASLFACQPLKSCRCTLNNCEAKQCVYDQISIIQKCGSFVCMFDKKHLSKELLIFSRDFLTEIITSIHEFKETNCGLYSSLWSTCGQIMYNLSLAASMEFLDESAELLSNLCSYIIVEDGIKSTNKFLRNSNPLSLVLHKLSGVYFRAEKYREAMIVTAFNGLISYQDEETKAFKMWANIKYKCSSEDVKKQTMIACLKADKAAIKELGVEIYLNDYDLVKLCAKEFQGLQKAKVNLTVAIKACLKELDSLQSNTMEFVEGVQYLGYHVLYFRDDCSIIEYIKKAEVYLRNFDKGSKYYSCLKANFEFLKFMERRNATNKKIKKEMQNAKNILQKGKDETKIHDQTIETDEVVPVYRMINMKHDANVAAELEEVLLNWKNCFSKEPREIVHCWEPQITLNMIIIAGEISRLYLSQSCEETAWILAYKVASALENHTACVYVTARSISLRYINDDWIEKSHSYAKTLKASEDTDDKSAVGMFWTSLSDFYFETGKRDEAIKLINDVKNLGSVDFAADVPVYLDLMDTIVRNYKLYSEDMEQEEYSKHIVHHMYSMISVNEILNSGGRRTYYSLNTLLDSVNHMALVMNSFISFREISAHLTLRLELAQSLGATLRVAECLKSLCYIDLSRLKLNDCEVKLQGIEQILDIEGFGLSMKSKCADSFEFRTNTVLTSHQMDVDDPLRDVIQNEASPILRKKTFVPPEYMLHDNCKCYRCLNIPYQYLVFSSAHIRAQVYALKDYSPVALKHFQGASDVRRKLLEKENDKITQGSKNPVKYYPWNKYYTMVDCVLFLIDFSKFIMNYKIPREKEAMEVVIEAINICEKFNLQTHPAYFAANELLFQYRFQRLRVNSSVFTVPDVDDIDISDLVSEEMSNKENNQGLSCVTPCHSAELPKRILHKKKTPPLLPLTKVNMRFSDSEDEDSKSTKTTRRKPTRKRLVNSGDELSSEETVSKPTTKSSSKGKSVSSKKSADTKTTKIPLSTVDETKSLERAFEEMSLQPELSQPIISYENLLSKVRDLKLEHFQKSPPFEFSKEEFNILKLVLNENELQEVMESMEKIQINVFKLNNKNVTISTRTSRLRSKTSSDCEETFEITMTKVTKILTNAVCRSRSSDFSVLSTVENTVRKCKASVSSKIKRNSKRSDVSRVSSPDLFSSDDDVSLAETSNSKVQESKNRLTVASVKSVRSTNENKDSRLQKSKDKLTVTFAENVNKGSRVTRSRSIKILSDSELNPKTSRKKS